MPEGHSLVFADRTISCVDSGNQFDFTAGEQEFFAQRGFTEAPKRCPSCRAVRKAARNQAGSGTADAGYGSARGHDGGNGAGTGYSFEYRERRPREMFEAACADCGGTASVPFRPSGIKPVYCSDCFQGHR